MRTYESALRRWEGYCKAAHVDAHDPSPSECTRYLTYLGKRLSAASMRVHLAALCTWERWAGCEPARWARQLRPSAEQLEVPALSRADVSQLIEAAAGIGESATLQARNRALFFMLYATGARVSELLARNTADLLRDSAGGTWLNFRTSKSKKGFAVWVMPAALDAFHAYLRMERRTFLAAGPLFCSTRGERLSAQMVRYIFRQVAAAAELPGVHPHSMRHALATHLDQMGVSPRVIQLVLGHKDVKTTLRYVHPELSAVQAALSQLTGHASAPADNRLPWVPTPQDLTPLSRI